MLFTVRRLYNAVTAVKRNDTGSAAFNGFLHDSIEFIALHKRLIDCDRVRRLPAARLAALNAKRNIV